MYKPNQQKPLTFLLLIMNIFLPTTTTTNIANRFLLGQTRFVRSFFGKSATCPVQTFSTMSGEKSCYPPGTFSVAFVTVPNESVAKKIAHGLVAGKLAACVNIIPQITSVYEWKGEIEEDSEVLLKIKTRTDKIQNLTEFVKKNHPYEVCEVISTPITDGNEDYLKWLGESVKP